MSNSMFVFVPCCCCHKLMATQGPSSSCIEVTVSGRGVRRRSTPHHFADSPLAGVLCFKLAPAASAANVCVQKGLRISTRDTPSSAPMDKG